MQEIHLTTREAILYLALIGAAAGFIIGLIPLFLGWRKGKLKLGIVALVTSVIVGGAVSFLLSILVTVVFVFLIFRKSPLDSTSVEESDDVADDDDTTL
jgi:CHASE2 domain-containing sensor protein